MIKIYPRLNAIIGATKDRRDVRRFKNGASNEINERFYRCLVNESGPSTNNPIKMLKRWKKAYDANMKKFTMIDNIKDIVTTKKKRR